MWLAKLVLISLPALPLHCLATAGAGRRVGENCEQTWALARPVMKLTRFYGKAAYLATLDDALLLITEDKLSDFIPLMVAAARAAGKKLGKAGLGRPLQGAVLPV